MQVQTLPRLLKVLQQSRSYQQRQISYQLKFHLLHGRLPVDFLLQKHLYQLLNQLLLLQVP
jgi:hypothetical protein